MTTQFAHPFSCIVSGPSQVGKTQLVKNIIKNAQTLIIPSPQHVIWCRAEAQPYVERELISYLGSSIEFRDDLPKMSDIGDMDIPRVIIVDDFMVETNEEILKLFTKGVHHRNVSIFFLVQNFFHANKQMRSITLNANYIVVFKNIRDQTQIESLAKQMYPGNVKFLNESFRDATSQPFGYLLLDLKPLTPDELRVRTGILPGDTQYVYKPTKQ